MTSYELLGLAFVCCLSAVFTGSAAGDNADKAGDDRAADLERPRVSAALRQGAWDEEWDGHGEGGGGGVAQGDAACSRTARCIPLRRCALVYDLLQRSCLASDRLRDISCGYSAGEQLICCPRGAEQPLSSSGGTGWGTSGSGSSSGGEGSSGGGGSNGWSTSASGGNQWSPSEPPEKATAFSSTCGTRLVAGLKHEGLGAQPWVARVGYKHVTTGKMSYPCCGSIIAPRTILTAAHCATAKSEHYVLNSVVTGDYDSRGEPDCTRSFCALPSQTLRVKQKMIYPGYERRIFKHDIALLILESPINYSVAAQPICLSDRISLWYGRQRARLVGWGRLPNQQASSPRQQQLELPLQPIERCASAYSRVIPVTRMQMCAGGEEGKDACSGFGGAPLLIDAPTDPERPKYYQVGMASFGSDKCGEKDIPSVYTNVMKYVEWIRSNMQT